MKRKKKGMQGLTHLRLMSVAQGRLPAYSLQRYHLQRMKGYELEIKALYPHKIFELL